MKFNKLKPLLIAACCAVTALWTEIQGMEDQGREMLPAGTIVSFAGEVSPDGWLRCDGQQYSNQRYPELYEVVRKQYVPDGSWVIEANKRSELEKYFYVPDLSGRDPILNYIINTGQANGQQQNEIVQLKERIGRLEASLEGLNKTPTRVGKF